MPKRTSKLSSSSLSGKVVLITGASQGIGLAITKALAHEGCSLVLTGRDQARLNRAVKSIGVDVRKMFAVVCDVREPAQVAAMAAAVRRKFRKIDILINNAGISHPNAEVANLPIESWREVIDTNLTGTFLVTQAVLPLMKAGSAIVNNLSIAAKRVFAGGSAYSASKYGALGFTNTLREELRSRDIRVIALLPGATDTAIWNTFWPDAPRKKMMSAETIAAAVASALALPANSTVEELTILPTAGPL